MKKLYIELFPKPDLEREWKNHKEHFDSGNPEYQTCISPQFSTDQPYIGYPNRSP